VKALGTHEQDAPVSTNITLKSEEIQEKQTYSQDWSPVLDNKEKREGAQQHHQDFGLPASHEPTKSQTRTNQYEQ
jgi:hypothetical protein